MTIQELIAKWRNGAVELGRAHGEKDGLVPFALETCADQLAEVVEASPWQPIETAPKDGELVLAWEIDSYPEVQRWEGGGWRPPLDHRQLRTPTHWMPIPPLPADGE